MAFFRLPLLRSRVLPIATGVLCFRFDHAVLRRNGSDRVFQPESLHQFPEYRARRDDVGRQRVFDGTENLPDLISRDHRLFSQVEDTSHIWGLKKVQLLGPPATAQNCHSSPESGGIAGRCLKVVPIAEH